MTKLFSIVLIVTLCACSTTQLQDASRWAPVAQIAAKDGTFLVLKKNPEYRQGFEQALEKLKILEAQPQVDFVTLLAVVKSFPIKELRGETAALLISDATIIIEGFAPQQGVILNAEKTAQLRVFVTAIRAGVEAGLALSRVVQ